MSTTTTKDPKSTSKKSTNSHEEDETRQLRSSANKKFRPNSSKSKKQGDHNNNDRDSNSKRRKNKNDQGDERRMSDANDPSRSGPTCDPGNQKLQKLLNDLEMIFNHEQNLSNKAYMGMYTLVYDICTESDKQHYEMSDKRMELNSGSGNHFESQNDPTGNNLYNTLQDFTEKRVSIILKNSESIYNNMGLGLGMGLNHTENSQGQGSSSLNTHIESSVESETTILKCYNQTWTKFLFSKQVFNSIATYLNRYWIKRMRDEMPESNIIEIKDLCLVIWKRSLFDKIQNLLTSSILRLVRRDRLGETVDYQLLQSVIDSYAQLGVGSTSFITNPNKNIDGSDASGLNQLSFQNGFNSSAFQQNKNPREQISLSVYKNCLEQQYLEELDQFYEQDSNDYIHSHIIEDYVIYAESKIEQEEKRCKNYLHESSIEKVMLQVNTKLVKGHLVKILDSFEPLLDNWYNNGTKGDDLKRMYSLCELGFWGFLLDTPQA